MHWGNQNIGQELFTNSWPAFITSTCQNMEIFFEIKIILPDFYRLKNMVLPIQLLAVPFVLADPPNGVIPLLLQQLLGQFCILVLSLFNSLFDSLFNILLVTHQ